MFGRFCRYIFVIMPVTVLTMLTYSPWIWPMESMLSIMRQVESKLQSVAIRSQINLVSNLKRFEKRTAIENLASIIQKSRANAVANNLDRLMCMFETETRLAEEGSRFVLLQVLTKLASRKELETQLASYTRTLITQILRLVHGLFNNTDARSSELAEKCADALAVILPKSDTIEVIVPHLRGGLYSVQHICLRMLKKNIDQEAISEYFLLQQKIRRRKFNMDNAEALITTYSS